MHALSVRREEINIVAGKAATHRRTNESASVWQGFCVAQYGWQVHLGQTKGVKGQDSKTLVTAGTIKRPLPCPIEGRETESISHNVKRKKQSKRKRKKDKNENREKRKEN